MASGTYKSDPRALIKHRGLLLNQRAPSARLPGKQRLSSIHFNAEWLEDLVNILNQGRGLKSLVIRSLKAKELRNTELAVPIGGHKESIQFLDFETCEAAMQI